MTYFVFFSSLIVALGNVILIGSSWISEVCQTVVLVAIERSSWALWPWVSMFSLSNFSVFSFVVSVSFNLRRYGSDLELLEGSSSSATILHS